MALFRFERPARPTAPLLTYVATPAGRAYVSGQAPGWVNALLLLAVIAVMLTGLFWILPPNAFSWSSGRRLLMAHPFFAFWSFWFVGAWIWSIFRPTVFKHVFYDDRAVIFRGGSKARFRTIQPAAIESMHVQSITFRKETFPVFVVCFRPLEPKWLGQSRDLKFAVAGSSDLGPLIAWARDRGIPVGDQRQNLVTTTV